ncbi:hypothetical protein CRE_14338 [Caenorhabditis remanei]|uniref:Uncharacterized protein n=1 Tax=Caenorhabditis remanei TaxID=31234 RepID=E3NH84_CAERE|nr:hypothetical protein CRE_14338 [Caenorhabditis remanei]
MSSTPATESRKMRQRHSEASHKMTTRGRPYPAQDNKEMNRLREENEVYRQQIQQLQEAELRSQENYRLVVEDYNGLLEEKDRENGELREQVKQLEESELKYRQLVEDWNRLVGQYDLLTGDLQRLEAEIVETNEKFEEYSKEMVEKLEEAQDEKLEKEEEIEEMKEHFKMRRNNMAHNMEVLRDEKEKEIEKLRGLLEESNNKSYGFRSRQVKRRLFNRLDDVLEFGDAEEQKQAQRNIKTMSVMLRNGEEIEELVDMEN